MLNNYIFRHVQERIPIAEDVHGHRRELEKREVARSKRSFGDTIHFKAIPISDKFDEISGTATLQETREIHAEMVKRLSKARGILNDSLKSEIIVFFFYQVVHWSA